MKWVTSMLVCLLSAFAHAETQAQDNVAASPPPVTDEFELQATFSRFTRPYDEKTKSWGRQ